MDPKLEPAPGERRKGADGTPRRWRLRDLHMACGGATAVETAFLLPVFLVFLLGICELARALWTQTALQFAVEAAARCAAITPTQCVGQGGTTVDVPAYAASQVYGLTIPSTAFTYTQNATCGVGSGGTSGGAEVDATYAFTSIVPQLVPFSLTMQAKSCHP